jgi:hypothetical protein
VKPVPAKPAPAVIAAGSPAAAMVVEQDESGALVPATTRSLPGSAAVEALRARPAAPIEIRRADGTVGREYPGGLLEYAVVRLGPDGKYVHTCLPEAPASLTRLDSTATPRWEDR